MMININVLFIVAGNHDYYTLVISFAMQCFLSVFPCVSAYLLGAQVFYFINNAFYHLFKGRFQAQNSVVL